MKNKLNIRTTVLTVSKSFSVKDIEVIVVLTSVLENEEYSCDLVASDLNIITNLNPGKNLKVKSTLIPNKHFNLIADLKKISVLMECDQNYATNIFGNWTTFI